MERGKKKQVFLHAMLLVGMLVIVPFMGYAVSISTEPSTERPVETRTHAEDSNQFKEGRRAVDEFSQLTPSSKTSYHKSAGVIFSAVAYQPYYGYNNYRGDQFCSGSCDGPSYQPPPYFRGNPAVYQDYYMYHNFNYGW